MSEKKDKTVIHFKRQLISISIIAIAVIVLTVLTGVYEFPQSEMILQLIWLLLELTLLITVIMMLLATLKRLNLLEAYSHKLEEITDTLEKNRSVLALINQNTRLSEKTKAIAFRDAERQALREVVFEKLQQKDFDSAYEITDEIAHSTGYKKLADELRRETDRYRNATDQERINQVISHIEKLLDSYQWGKASAYIERLIKAEPDSEDAGAMRQKLLTKKQERKKALLNIWDEAVKREDTERSLEILKELDQYLTPNEGLALQEAARDVFKNKLHSLGVEFSLAVSGRQWAHALEVGERIIGNFPNSRMAEEIREKWDILTQKVQQQSTG